MIEDLCILMLTAGIVSLLFKAFKQPVVLGYIVAGMIVGPHVLGDALVSSEENVETWGEIGVLFLLFSLGLEFSFKKLIQVGSTAIIGAGTIVVGMMSLGMLTAYLSGLNAINSLFLGGMLCMSSTTIVFKAIEDSGMSSHKFAKVCFGILVVEDLFAVVLMVLLSSIAVKNSFEGTEMLLQIGKLIGYLLLWFVGGIYIIPTFFGKFRKHLNDETLTIFSVGLCLGMVLLAVRAGFSSALGAFVIGSILAETLEAEKIEHLIQPIKNIFGSIFFVSVGMMIEPVLLLEYWLPIVVITGVVIIGQIVFGSLGTLLSGQSLRVSLQTGFSLVQVGEFAFIIAQLGENLNVTNKALYPIVVAVSVITTFLTPYVMRLAYPTLDFLNNRMSPSTKRLLDNYAYNINKEKNGPKMLSSIIRKIFIFIVSLPGINRIFKRFNDNLYAREHRAEQNKTVSTHTEMSLLSLDIHVSEFTIPADSKFCGRSFQELELRSKTGVSVVGIIRGDITINVPGGNRHIYPNDKIVVAGTDTQMDSFQKLLNASIDKKIEKDVKRSNIILSNIRVENQSHLIGKSIMNSRIREEAQCIVMGVTRDREPYVFSNPNPTLIIEDGDMLIIAGERDRIRQFVERNM